MGQRRGALRWLRCKCCLLLAIPCVLLVALCAYIPSTSLLEKCRGSTTPHLDCISQLTRGKNVLNFLSQKQAAEEDGAQVFVVDVNSKNDDQAQVKSDEVNILIRPANQSPFHTAFLFSEAFKTLRRVADNAVYNINVTASILTSPGRAIPDTRPDVCRLMKWPRDLPTVSIIIPFYMEHWSALLRTLGSIYNRTEPSLIEEIILIDDSNDIAVLKEPLRLYLSGLPKLRLLRTKKREGLIRARSIGSRAARGEVLVIIDGHVEVNNDWLRPLLAEIAKNRTTIAVPALDHIDANSMQYEAWPSADFGSFNWQLDYVWTRMPDDLEALFRSGHSVPTPTLLGCAMAVDRRYWISQGGYDEELYIWGGESLELSFRTWMCGGSVRIVPCSKVGHIFRSNLPYIFDIGTVYKNLQRVAEVWMDEYKKYYFQTTNKSYKFSPSERETLRKRSKLRRTLNCKDFSWYLQNVAKTVKTPPYDAVLFGRLKNLATKKCLSSGTNSQFLMLNACEVHPERQDFYFTGDNRIKHKDTGCLMFVNPGKLSLGQIGPCTTINPAQKWLFKPIVPDQLKSLATGLELRMAIGQFRSFHGHFENCLQAVLYRGQPVLILRRCDDFIPSQYWIVSHELHKMVNVIDNLSDAENKKKALR
ncbi:hypothetical protein LSH36_99g04050 [Paralvinella palmiformis]|uniref:Polypeptide N-acetylgalactosaminyltransferase n=1 Tax=Paralvinella palmiformis TaxID=53620 RepID=A0AAD9K0R7_9ANNE|nr:hypothetical protein LSH36_99g04050 [Paralvinella palmiformis]